MSLPGDESFQVGAHPRRVERHQTFLLSANRSRSVFRSFGNCKRPRSRFLCSAVIHLLPSQSFLFGLVYTLRSSST